jgi:uncharacterized protein DUF4360
MWSPNMRLPRIFFLVTIQAVAIPALRDLVNQAVTPAVPPPDDLKVRAVTNSGTGCPKNSISVSLSLNRALMTYGFGNMSVDIGPDVPPSEKMKTCQLHTTLESRSQAASFAVATVTYKGLAILDPGVNLAVFATWLFPDVDAVDSFSYTVNDTDGKENNILSFRGDTTVPPERRIWTPCADVGMFTMNVRVRLESANATGSGQIFNDDQFMEGFLMQVGLDWRECNKSLN